MARIAGVNLPREKRSEIGLTYIYGIGRPTSQQILSALDIDRDTKIRDLTDAEVARLRAYIDANVTVEGDLRRERSGDIKRLMEIACYRGTSPQARPSGSRSADTNERSNAEGPEEDRRASAQEVTSRP